MFGLFGQQAPFSGQSPFGQQAPFAQNQLQAPDPHQMAGQYMPQQQYGLFGSQAPQPPAQPSQAAPPPMDQGAPSPGGDGMGYVRDAMGDYANLFPQQKQGGGGMMGGMNMQQAMQFAKMFAGG